MEYDTSSLIKQFVDGSEAKEEGAAVTEAGGKETGDEQMQLSMRKRKMMKKKRGGECGWRRCARIKYLRCSISNCMSCNREQF